MNSKNSGHVFPEDMWMILESEKRRRIEPAEKLVKEIVSRVKKRDVAFDIGAGTGYFTGILSRTFKKVYAVEKSEKLAGILHSKGFKNVGIIVSDVPPQIDFEVDLVLFADSLHEIPCKKEYAEWCKRSKYVVIVDWKKDVCPDFGPPDAHRLSRESIIELFKDFNFKELEIYTCHFVLFGSK
jgi:SAM-dependent methyltransferase